MRHSDQRTEKNLANIAVLQCLASVPHLNDERLSSTAYPAQITYGMCLQAAAVGRVACRQVGFQNGLARSITSTPAGSPIPPAWLETLDCNGTEPHISACERVELGVTECSRGVIRLICSDAGAPSGPMQALLATSY